MYSMHVFATSLAHIASERVMIRFCHVTQPNDVCDQHIKPSPDRNTWVMQFVLEIVFCYLSLSNAAFSKVRHPHFQKISWQLPNYTLFLEGIPLADTAKSLDKTVFLTHQAPESPWISEPGCCRQQPNTQTATPTHSMDRRRGSKKWQKNEATNVLPQRCICINLCPRVSASVYVLQQLD